MQKDTQISCEELEAVAFTLKKSRKLNSYVGWTDFQRKLIGKTKRSNQKSNFGEYSLLHDLRDVLQLWCDLKQNQATLTTLLDVLKNCGLLDEAEIVKERLGYMSTEQIQDFTQTIKADKNLQAHISISINENIATLSLETNFNDEFLGCLKTASLNAEEKEIENQHFNNCNRSFMVYKQLWKEPWHLSHVVAALEKTKQYRPSRILRRLYKEASQKSTAETLMRSQKDLLYEDDVLMKKQGNTSNSPGLCFLQV